MMVTHLSTNRHMYIWWSSIWVLTYNDMKSSHIILNKILSLQDINDEDCVDKSTLVYVSKLKKFIEKIRHQRGVKMPFLTFGLDGGQVCYGWWVFDETNSSFLQDKCIVVMQMHELQPEPEPEPTTHKDGGRCRSIIVARGIIYRVSQKKCCFLIL